MKRADLHLHTNFSDGTFSPKELVQEALKAGLACIAVTDHDTVDGISPTQEIAGDSLEVIPGIELTAEVNSTEIHILGYYIDSTSTRLLEALVKMCEVRRKRIFEITAKLKKLGLSLEADEVFTVAGCGCPGRLHVARAMAQKGIVTSIPEAFGRYLSDKGPAYVSKLSLTPEQAVGVIKDAGGIPILAHPYTSHCEELLPRFIKAGIRGLEVFYPEHSQSLIRYYQQVAKKYGLLMTGGSDCHGSVKPNINVGSVTIAYELVEKLKEEKNAHR